MRQKSFLIYHPTEVDCVVTANLLQIEIRNTTRYVGISMNQSSSGSGMGWAPRSKVLRHGDNSARLHSAPHQSGKS